MRRREFIRNGTVVLAGLSITVARAQQPERVRRVGVLSPFAENDAETQARLAAFKQRLQDLGWTDGRNVLIDIRFGENFERTRVGAEELVALAPDVILAYSNPAMSALMQATRTSKIVFTQVSDPVGSGFVASLANPGGNITGFHGFEPAIGGKWLEMLKEIAPQLSRVAVLHDPNIAANVAFLRAAEAASSTFGVAVTASGVRSAADVERAMTEFAQEPNSGLVVAPAPVTFDQRELIATLAARLRLPAIYSQRFVVSSGGLISYGIDGIEQFRQAAGYVDRILRGANPGDLPVQLPTKYQLVINMKVARALGLAIPDKLLFTADEVLD